MDNNRTYNHSDYCFYCRSYKNVQELKGGIEIWYLKPRKNQN